MILRLKLVLTHIIWIILAGWMFLYSDWLRSNMGALPFIVIGLVALNYFIWRDEWQGQHWELTRVDNRAKATSNHDEMVEAGLQQIRSNPHSKLTQALKKLSDEELIRLKTRLQDGTIDDSILIEEIQKQKRS